MTEKFIYSKEYDVLVNEEVLKFCKIFYHIKNMHNNMPLIGHQCLSKLWFFSLQSLCMIDKYFIIMYSMNNLKQLVQNLYMYFLDVL